jgi:hypothetical protein
VSPSQRHSWPALSRERGADVFTSLTGLTLRPSGEHGG